MIKYLVGAFVLSVLHCKINCAQNTTIEKAIIKKIVDEKIESFENYVTSSLELQQQDLGLMMRWNEEKQWKILNVTTGFRLEMNRHKEHSFGVREDICKWTDCMVRFSNDVSKPESQYYEGEKNCLSFSASLEREKRMLVAQIGREIFKWQRSYQYIKHLCHEENPGDEEEARTCIVGSILADDYNITFQRLLIQRLEAMLDLRAVMTSSVTTLEQCLNNEFSRYLDGVRGTMRVLNRCYELSI